MRKTQIYIKKHGKTLKYTKWGGGVSSPNWEGSFAPPPLGCKNITGPISDLKTSVLCLLRTFVWPCCFIEILHVKGQMLIVIDSPTIILHGGC